MTDIGTIRQAIANRILTITTGNVNVYPTFPKTFVLPSIAVGPHTQSEPETFNGGRRYEFDIYIYVAPSDDSAGQRAIDPYLSQDGSQSIQAAIENDPSLTGTIESCWTQGFKSYGILTELNGTTTKALGAILSIVVLD